MAVIYLFIRSPIEFLTREKCQEEKVLHRHPPPLLPPPPPPRVPWQLHQHFVHLVDNPSQSLCQLYQKLAATQQSNATVARNDIDSRALLAVATLLVHGFASRKVSMSCDSGL